MSVLRSCILLEQNTQPGFLRFGLNRNPALRSGELPVCIYDLNRREDVGNPSSLFPKYSPTSPCISHVRMYIQYIYYI